MEGENGVSTDEEKVRIKSENKKLRCSRAEPKEAIVEERRKEEKSQNGRFIKKFCCLWTQEIKEDL